MNTKLRPLVFSSLKPMTTLHLLRDDHILSPRMRSSHENYNPKTHTWVKEVVKEHSMGYKINERGVHFLYRGGNGLQEERWDDPPPPFIPSSVPIAKQSVGNPTQPATQETGVANIGSCHWVFKKTCPDINVRFYLYTGTHPDTPEELTLGEEGNWTESSFNPAHPTKIIIHGFASDMNLVHLVKIRTGTMRPTLPACA
uniref:Uncharacterized protein n=1 Tax=Timema genevievae TaxID=629358 RepID=A0A7R9JN08_TIMGE|nr:unnamed protein product [Timema genevievae]